QRQFIEVIAAVAGGQDEGNGEGRGADVDGSAVRRDVLAAGPVEAAAVVVTVDGLVWVGAATPLTDRGHACAPRGSTIVHSIDRPRAEQSFAPQQPALAPCRMPSLAYCNGWHIKFRGRGNGRGPVPTDLGPVPEGRGSDRLIAAKETRTMDKRSCWGAVIGAVLTALSASGAPSMETVPKLYVTNSAGDNLHVIDLRTFRVIATIKAADHPHGAAASADGRFLFTTIEGDHTLRVIDTSTDKLVRTVRLTGLPNQCAVTPDGLHAGVPIRDSDRVDLVDVSKGKILKSLPVKV